MTKHVSLKYHDKEPFNTLILWGVYALQAEVKQFRWEGSYIYTRICLDLSNATPKPGKSQTLST